MMQIDNNDDDFKDREAYDDHSLSTGRECDDHSLSTGRKCDDHSLSTSRKHDNHSLSTSEKLHTLPKSSEYEPYLIMKEFKYTMTLIDNKITALYKLCRHLSDEQQKNSKSLKKLIFLDELLDSFW